MDWWRKNTHLQEQALQRYAIAFSEFEEACRKAKIASQQMVDARAEAERHGIVSLPVTAVLSTGEHVLIRRDSKQKGLYSAVISAPLFVDGS